MKDTNTVLIIGRPGSGKGTQAKLLADKLGWKNISSGNTFRDLRNAEGPLGNRIRETYDKGLLLPYWFPVYLFERATLDLDSSEGIVCEGFCRALRETELFADIIEWLGRKLVVINLEVSEDEALRRQLSRAQVEHRPDSSDEAKIRVRFEEFMQHTHPVLAYFEQKGMLIKVNGEQSPEKVAEDINAALAV